ncbi:MAG TPA: tetratricopeptide repeat protein [Vicinamibacteria bacterium]
MRRRLRSATALVGTLALLASCAPPPRAPLPDSEEYVFPASVPGQLSPAEAQRIEKAWRRVLGGDALAAQRDMEKLLVRSPGLVPAETTLAYARLRAGRLDEAAHRFEGVLSRQPDYLPALAGAAATAARRGDAQGALQLYRRALGGEPSNAFLRQRVAELRVQVTERRVAAARAAQEAGRSEEAVATYRQALESAPEVAGLRLELANLLVAAGDVEGAVGVLKADPTEDRQVLLRLADVETQRRNHPGALEAYRRLLARDPHDDEAQRRSRDVREAIELEQMPEEYRRIATAPAITRADLAALVAVKVTALARVPAGEPQVAVDISGSWARSHVIKALAYEILTVYPNHTFQPAATARRGDVAHAVQRILDLLKWPAGPGPNPTDMSRSNVYYYPATRVVAAGLMDLTPAGSFEAWRPVSGPEAVAVIEALVRLVGP